MSEQKISKKTAAMLGAIAAKLTGQREKVGAIRRLRNEYDISLRKAKDIATEVLGD